MIPGNDLDTERLSVVKMQSICCVWNQGKMFSFGRTLWAGWTLMDATDMFRYWKWNTYARPQCLDCRKETLIWISDLRKKA